MWSTSQVQIATVLLHSNVMHEHEWMNKCVLNGGYKVVQLAII